MFGKVTNEMTSPVCITQYSPALFCSSLTLWLFQGGIAISTSRCTSVIAVTPSLQCNHKKCFLHFDLSPFNRSDDASSFTYQQVCPSTTGIWLPSFFLLTESFLLFFPDFWLHSASFTDTIFLKTTPQFNLKYQCITWWSWSQTHTF